MCYCGVRDGARDVRPGRGKVFGNLVSVVGFFDGVLRWQS